MSRPMLPWLERESTNRDSVLFLVLGIGVPLLLGVLDRANVLDTLPLGAWFAITAAILLIPVAYRVGGRSAAAGIPLDVDRYAGHVQDALDTLQLVLTDEIETMDLGEFVQEGIFEPAATIMSQRGRGDLRFSIVMPADDDPNEFEMEHALGHSAESRRKFRLRIVGSFAGLAYADGRPHVSNDTDDDDRFTRHPHARPGRDYRSIVAAPIPRGHEIIAVLVVVAQNPDGFGDVDVAYIAQLAMICSVVNAIADMNRAESDG